METIMLSSEAFTSRPISRPRSGLLARLKNALAIRRQHAHLSRLDDIALRDLGLTRQEVAQELSRPFWMVPGFGQVNRPRR
jgi:uncharacterized protein YjiS (DUF1127 family)